MMKKMFSDLTVYPEIQVQALQLLTSVNITAIIAGIVFSMPIGNLVKQKIRIPVWISDLSVIVTVVLVFMCLASGSYNPFIYFRF